jgi:hypothetical protein
MFRSGNEQKGRVNIERYSALPEGHRTTLVVGMCDMLQFASLYADEQHKERLNAMLEYINKTESGAVRMRFDEYLKSGNTLPAQGAAPLFFNALNSWSGFDK